MPPVIGVDLGNCNSFPAYVSEIDERTHRGGVELALLPASCNKMGIPSYIHCNKNGRITYGEAAAKGVPMANRRNMLKRNLGKSETIGGTTVDYDKMITGLIAYIVDTANQQLQNNQKPTSNEISLAFPVVFSLAQKEHLRQLAEQAVLADGRNVKVVGMIQEPAAAALSYLGTLPASRGRRDYKVMVYDLGGGTFDATIVTAHQNRHGVMESYEVKDQSGSPRAGNEFTERMMNLIRTKVQELGGDIAPTDFAKETLRREAEDLKVLLSNESSVWYQNEEGDTVEITRNELAAAVKELIEETISVSQALYNRCETKPDMIILTGGQSQMPAIRQALEMAFPQIGKDNIITHNPQQAIAFGAARFGTVVQTAAENQQAGEDLRNTPVVVPILRTGRMLGLGNVVRDDNSHRRFVYELVPRNTALPITDPVFKPFHTIDPCIKRTIHLREAKTDTPDIYNEADFRTVATLTVDFHISTPQIVNYEVAVTIDETNNVHFIARDPQGAFPTVTVQADYSQFVGG